MAETRTLLIGDAIATGLAWPLSRIPGSAPIWDDGQPGSSIYWWAHSNELEQQIAKITSHIDGEGNPVKPPTLILICLGRGEILSEPDKVTAEELAGLAADVGALVEKVKATGAVPLWILPPAIHGEGKARATISSALAAKGVRAFHGETRITEAKASRSVLLEPEFAPEVYQQLARQIAMWVPIGRIQIGPIPQRHPTSPTTNLLDQVSAAPATLATKVSGLSRGKKIGLALALLGVIGGGAALAKRI